MEKIDDIDEESELCDSDLYDPDLYEEYSKNPKDRYYLLPLIGHIKRYKDDGTILQLQITRLMRTGFVVKVAGLYATIIFENMPWKYDKPEYWNIVCGRLIYKTILGTILSVKLKPLSIYVCADIPQFKKPKFIVAKTYRGVVLEKRADSILIELGDYFNWKHGSVPQVVKKSHFASQEEFNATAQGQKTYVVCIGVKAQGEKGQGEGIFINNTIPAANENEKEQEQEQEIAIENAIPAAEENEKELSKIWIGKVVPVAVVGTEPGTHKYMVQNQYDAIMDNVYPEHIIDEYVFTLAKNNLLNTDIIHCEIIQIDTENQCLHVKWTNAKEIDSILRRTIPADTEIKIYSLMPINLLSHDLLLAEKILMEYPTGTSEKFPDSKTFTNALQEARERLKQNNLSCVDNIADWFQTDSDWDIFTNKVWFYTRCRILAVIDQLQKENDEISSIVPTPCASDE